jgi:hypothetical protein
MVSEDYGLEDAAILSAVAGAHPLTRCVPKRKPKSFRGDNAIEVSYVDVR